MGVDVFVYLEPDTKYDVLALDWSGRMILVDRAGEEQGVARVFFGAGTGEANMLAAIASVDALAEALQGLRRKLLRKAGDYQIKPIAAVAASADPKSRWAATAGPDDEPDDDDEDTLIGSAVVPAPDPTPVR
jgi:hypothetical protein